MIDPSIEIEQAAHNTIADEADTRLRSMKLRTNALEQLTAAQNTQEHTDQGVPEQAQDLTSKVVPEECHEHTPGIIRFSSSQAMEFEQEKALADVPHIPGGMSAAELQRIVISASAFDCIGLENQAFELDDKIRANALNILEDDQDRSVWVSSLVKSLLEDLLQVCHISQDFEYDLGIEIDRSSLLTTATRLIRISCDQHFRATGRYGLKSVLLIANTMKLQKLIGYDQAARRWQEHLSYAVDQPSRSHLLVSATLATSLQETLDFVWEYFQSLSFSGMQDFIHWSMVTIFSSQSYRDFVHTSMPSTTGALRMIEAGRCNAHMLFCGLHTAWAEFSEARSPKSRRFGRTPRRDKKLLAFVRNFVMHTGLSVSDLIDLVVQLVVEEQGQLSTQLSRFSCYATLDRSDPSVSQSLVAFQAAALLRLHEKLVHAFPHKFLVHRWLKTWMPSKFEKRGTGGNFEKRSTDLSFSVHLYEDFFTSWISEHWQEVQDCEPILSTESQAMEESEVYAYDLESRSDDKHDMMVFKSLARRFSDITMSSSNKSLELPSSGLRVSGASSTASSLRKLLARHSTGTTSDKSFDRMSWSDKRRSQSTVEQIAADVEMLLHGSMPRDRASTYTVLAGEEDIDWSQWARHSIA